MTSPPKPAALAQPGSVPWLERRDLITLSGVVALALAARLLHLWDQADNPLLATPLVDGRSYLDWSRRILAGDLASRHQGAFYQAPLYSYFLALVAKLAGTSLWAIRMAQALLGALSVGLVFLAGRRLVGWGAGLAGGLLLAFYGPAIFYESLLQKEALACFLSSLVLLALVVAAEGEGLARWLYAGVALGGLALLRENALLVVPVLLLWLLIRPRLEPRRLGGWQPALALALGVALALLPVLARNRVVAGEWLLTTSQAGANFYIGNHAGASGTYEPLSPGRSDTRFERRDAQVLAEAARGRPLSAREASRYWWGRGLRFAREQPFAWLRLTLAKAWMVSHRHELTDSDNPSLYRRYSPWLRALFALGHFGLLLPLAAAGWVPRWSTWRGELPLLLVMASLQAGVVLFFVFGRYRLPVAPFLAVYAGAGLVSGWEILKRRHWKALLAPATALLLVGLVANWPAPKRWATGEAMGLVNLGVALATQGRYDEAVAAYREAVALEPGLVEGQLNLGNLLLVRGKAPSAMPHLLAAARLAPQDGETQHQLGHAHLALGDGVAARRAFEQALRLARQARDVELERQLVTILAAQPP